MSVFQMDTEQLRSAADTVHQLSANMSEFKLQKPSLFLDCGDDAVSSALGYFTTMYRTHSDAAKHWLDKTSGALRDTAQATEDMDDEIAETFKSIFSKLQKRGSHAFTTRIFISSASWRSRIYLGLPKRNAQPVTRH